MYVSADALPVIRYCVLHDSPVALINMQLVLNTAIVNCRAPKIVKVLAV